MTSFHELLNYNPSNGLLSWRPRDLSLFDSERIWKSWNSRFANRTAGTPIKSGHILIRIQGKPLLAHRVIWHMMTGAFPIGIDHINGNPADNRWDNLREADQATNSKNAAMSRNNTSGHIGVSWDKARLRWTADIKVNRRSIRIGYFKGRDEAIAARKAAEIKFGFHPNHGRAPHGKEA